MARSTTSELIMSLIDRVSGPARKVGSAVRVLNGVVRDSAGTQVSMSDRVAAAQFRTQGALDRARMGVLDSVGAYYALKGAIAAPVQAAMQFESAMADVKKVVDFSDAADLNAFQKGLLDMSKRIPLGVDGLAAIAAAAGQAGIAKGDILEFTEAAAKIGVAFDISADQAGDSMAKLMTGLGMSLPEVVSLSDAMNHLSNSQASSAAEILDVVRRTGAMGKQYGFSAVQVAAFASAMISSGAQSDVAATSFMNMGRALTRGASATKRQRSAFKTLGKDSEQVAKAMQEDAVGTTYDVLEAISKLPKEMQASIASDLFGDEARALGPLLTNLALVRDSLGLVGDESKYAGSATKEFIARSATFENNMQLFRNTLTRLKISIGNSLIPVLTTLMETIEPMLDRISEWVSAHPELTGNILATVGALIALKGAIAGIKYVGLLGMGGALSSVGRGAAFLWDAAAGSVALQSALGKMNSTPITAIQKMMAGLSGMVRAVPGIALLVNGITAIGGAVATISAPVWGTFAVVAAAVAAAGVAIWKYWDRISSVLSGVGQALGEILAPAIEKLRPILDWFAQIGEAISAGWERAKSALEAVGEWFSGFFSKEVLSEDQKGEYRNAGYNLVMSFWDGMKSVMSAMISWAADRVDAVLAPFRAAASYVAGAFSNGNTQGVTSDPLGTGFEGGGSVDGERAKGGPVSPGRTYLVGEDGPETFTPTGSGYVHPNGKGPMAAGTAGSAGASGNVVKIGAININPNLSFPNATAADAESIARTVMARIKDEIGVAMRGVMADVSMG